MVQFVPLDLMVQFVLLDLMVHLVPSNRMVLFVLLVLSGLLCRLDQWNLFDQ
jgi:hypothetical protein